jgi:transposase InsO family protein
MDEKMRQEVANFRYGLIAPIVTRKLEPGEQAMLLREITSHDYNIPGGQSTKLQIRTLERYLRFYREGGWDALLPSVRADKLACRQITPDVLAKAIALKRENPARSVRQIMAILELAGLALPGALRESTLSKQLRRRNLTKKALEKETGTFRRFEAEYRNACWQGDVQHTIYLPHPDQTGKKKMAYLVAWMDDYSRMIVGSQFYFEERLPRLEDCFKKALLRHGCPTMIYVDNGAIYSARHFAQICGRLKTELKHTRPYRPQGRGKQEKFFRFVDQSFVPEAYDLIEQGKLKTLADLNRFFAAWLDVAYQQRIHSTFKQRPADRFLKCEHPIRVIPPHELAEIFLLEEKRKVDKTCCVALLGTTYEVESCLAGEAVDLRFDPYEMSVIQVWKDGVRRQDACMLEKLSFRRAKERPEQATSSAIAPRTGLNYVELAYDKFMTEQKERGLRDLRDEGRPS